MIFNKFYRQMQMMMGVWIHQDAWFSLANFDKDTSRYYQIKKVRQWCLCICDQR